jgi:vesicle coat complex subunit
VQIDPIDERIRLLCAKAATAQGSELVTVLKQLRAALREHNDFVRKMALRTLNRVAAKEGSSNFEIPPDSADSKAAD